MNDATVRTGWSSSVMCFSRLVFGERSSQRVEQGPGAFLALRRRLVAVEKNSLLREDELRCTTRLVELHGGHGDRDSVSSANISDVETIRWSTTMSRNSAKYVYTGPPGGPPRLTSRPPTWKSSSYPLPRAAAEPANQRACDWGPPKPGTRWRPASRRSA